MTTPELQQRISKHSTGTDGLKGKKNTLELMRVNEENGDQALKISADLLWEATMKRDGI
jgi:hypothetical protein